MAHSRSLIKLTSYFVTVGADPGIGTGVPFVVAVSVSGILLLLLLLIILLCIFKQRKEKKRRRAADVTQDDENPVYGDYSHPDPRMEVEDTNAYYSSGLVDPNSTDL